MNIKEDPDAMQEPSVFTDQRWYLTTQVHGLSDRLKENPRLDTSKHSNIRNKIGKLKESNRANAGKGFTMAP